MGCIVEKLKSAFNKYLQSVLDQPGYGGSVGLRAAASNSLVDQCPSPAASTQPGL